MYLHEYQAKELLRRYGLPVCDGFVIQNTDQLKKILHDRGWQSCVLKAQIHAGGRGKAGAIQIAKTATEAQALAKTMLGKTFVNEQTGPCGKPAHSLLITPFFAIARECYLAITYDRKQGGVYLMSSKQGGVDIESHALQDETSGVMYKARIPISKRLYTYQKYRLAKTLDIPISLRSQLYENLDALCKLFFELDASILEINPWALTQDNQWVILDTKLVIDDNAIFRQSSLANLEDILQKKPQEVEATAAGLAYVGMDGNIGCMVNGAGLAMATMDLLERHGGKAANFLDVGGGADEDRLMKGCRILLQDPRVGVIFVHIFGGIMDCFLIVKAIINVVQNKSSCPPLVFRMEGNGVDKARALLKESGLIFDMTDDLTQAAKLCVNRARQSINRCQKIE